ncbi:MAG: histidine triad nucleotide-binding protein [Bacillota bacterium]
MNDCIFCKMVKKEIVPKIAFEDEDILAFHDISPKAPVHLLIIPKKHLSDIGEMAEEDINLIGKMHYVAKKLAQDFAIDQSGYRLVTNCKKDSGQEVFHLHYHLIGGRQLGSFV